MPFTRRSLLGAGALAVLAACTKKDTSGLVPRQVPVDGSIPTDTVVQRTSGPKSVVMIGDSITVGATPQLEAMFTYLAFTSIKIDAQVSRRIEVGNGRNEPLNGIAVANKLIQERTPDELWVVALGTNDIGKGMNDDSYRTLIDKMLAVVPSQRLLVWVNCIRWDRPADGFNSVLAERLGARGNSVVADWFTQVQQRPNELLADGIHPNKEGSTVFAYTVANAIAALV